ncbi:MAG TPA: hypothetical protein VFO86_06395 [Terriglobia bacterium]|nr:hypothetical protein [Terriglobia bacterium]
MTTKAPAGVAEYPQESLEKIAYESVSDIPTQEPNDRNRLGYSVWSWLREHSGTLEQAIRSSGSRTHIDYAEVLSIVTKRLEERGIKIQ